MAKKGLGRGLSALLGDNDDPAPVADEGGGDLTPRQVPVAFLHPNPFQPRRHFDPAEMESLIDSVRQRGVLQPILVRPAPGRDGEFEIIAGERRWRAAQAAQLHDVPVVVKALNDQDALEIALIENIQRQDLSPLEEAEGYRRLIDEFSYTQEDLARAIGKSRSHVANMLRLLTLPDAVKTLVDSRQLTAGHARALLAVDDPEAVARQAIDENLTVRDLEKLGQKVRQAGNPKAPRPEKDADTMALERELTESLGLQVAIGYVPEKGGNLQVQFRTLDQLDALIARLRG